MQTPYVVSADVYRLLRYWADEKGFVLPVLDFFEEIREGFRWYMNRMFPAFDLVSEEEVSDGIAEMLEKTWLHPIGLDRAYVETSFHLDIARVVDETGKDRGLRCRPGTPSLLRQVRSLKEAGLTEVLLVDDVVYTGELLERLIRSLSCLDVHVFEVVVGVGVNEGIDRVSRLAEVRCVRRYERVVDEVCERDFYPGVPYSGRLLRGGMNVGVPYLLPFGDPGKWASIPCEHQASFSNFCLCQTIRLFEEIEESSRRIVTCADLGRLVKGLPRNETRFVEALRKVL